MGTCPVYTVSRARDLFGLGSSSVLSRAFMKGRQDDVCSTCREYIPEHTAFGIGSVSPGLDWDLHCIQNWASVCLYPHPHTP